MLYAGHLPLPGQVPWHIGLDHQEQGLLPHKTGAFQFTQAEYSPGGQSAETSETHQKESAWRVGKVKHPRKSAWLAGKVPAV